MITPGLSELPAPNPPGEKKRSPFRIRRWKVALLVGLVGVAIGLRALLAPLIERGAAFGSRYYLGLPARIEHASLSLFQGVLVLENVSVGNMPDSVTPAAAALNPPVIAPSSTLLHVDRIVLRLSWRALFTKTLRLTELVIEAPSIRACRESDGQIDPLRFAKPTKPPEPSVKKAAGKAASEPWGIAIDHFTLRMPDVAVIERASGKNLIEFSLKSFGLDALMARGSELAFGAVAIRAPVLRVDNNLRISKPPSAGKEDTVAQEAGTKDANTTSAPQGAGCRIKKIDVERAKFTWVGQEGPLDVMLTFRASELSADQGKRFPIDLALQIENGKLRLSGEAGILPPTFKGDFTWTGLPLPPLLIASQPKLARWLRSANSSGELRIDADVAGAYGPAALRISGSTTLDSLAIADPEEKEASLGWERLDLVMDQVVIPFPETGKPTLPTKADFKLIRLLRPKIRYNQPAPAFQALVEGASSSPAPPAAKNLQQPVTSRSEPPAPAPSVMASISSLEITGGDVDFQNTTSSSVTTFTARNLSVNASSVRYPSPSADSISFGAGLLELRDPTFGHATTSTVENLSVSAHSLHYPSPSAEEISLGAKRIEIHDTKVTPATTTTLRDISVSARSLRYPDPSAEAISIHMTLPEQSTLTITGSMRPGNLGDFSLFLEALDLPPFSPYAMAAGASLDAGQLSLQTTFSTRGDLIQADNDLVLKQLGVSLRDPSSFSKEFAMTIDLAISLLSDASGQIRLNIPIQIDPKGTTVSTGAVIGSALKAALLSTLGAPLKLLGAAFEGKPGAANLVIAPIPCPAGSAELAPEASARIDGLVKLLAQRPTMSLVLRGRTSAEEQPVIAEQILIERIQSGQGLPKLDHAGLLEKHRILQCISKRARGEQAAIAPKDQLLFERYLAAVEISKDRLDSLAKSRAERAKAILVSKGASAKRLSVGDRETQGSAGVVISFTPYKTGTEGR